MPRLDDQVWLEQLYQDHFRLLLHISRTFTGFSPSYQSKIEDEIQEVFLLAWKKREKLKCHPNPGGWLVEAMRKRLLAHYRKWRREQKHIAFSLDGEHLPQTPSTDGNEVFTAAADGVRRETLYKILGHDDAELFTLFCIDRVPASELTKRFSMTEACIRMRASRIRKKILSHPEIFLTVALILALRF